MKGFTVAEILVACALLACVVGPLVAVRTQTQHVHKECGRRVMARSILGYLCGEALSGDRSACQPVALCPASEFPGLGCWAAGAVSRPRMLTAWQGLRVSRRRTRVLDRDALVLGAQWPDGRHTATLELTIVTGP